MDKLWMSKDRLSKEYEEGVETFIDFARGHASGKTSIRCPCVKCVNLKILNTNEVRNHLVAYGIDQRYDNWIWHGETLTSYSRSNVESNLDYNINEQVYEDNSDDNIVEMVETAQQHCEDDPKKFKKLLADAEKPLYPGCRRLTKLGTLVKLYHLKARFEWSDTSFTELLTLLKDILPENNELPTSTYEAKKTLVTLGMTYEKIHACPNDCCLYRKEYADASNCPHCNESRWMKRKNSLEVKEEVKVGGLIAPSFFFHKPSPSISKTKVVNDEEKSWKKEKKELMTQYTRMAKQVLETNDVKDSGEQTPLSDRGSCQLQAPKASTSNEIVDQGKSCDLAIGNIKNIVASGIVYERIKSHEVVYGVPLSPNDVRVLITLVSNFSALLPIPVAGSIEIVSNAIGSHVPWPKSFVIVDKEEKERKKIHRELVALKEKRPKNDVSRLQMPVAVKYMLRFLEDMKDEYLDIPIPKHVFGYDFNFHLMKDSMKQFCMMEELASSVISAYISYLCESEPIILEQYAFLQPSLISHGSGPEEQRSRFLCNRLREIKNKLLICPCNPGNHWMLVVISLKSSTVWSIDSIGHGIRDYVKTIVNTAIRMFYAQTNIRSPIFNWVAVQCAKQLGNTECGYYTMKFIRDIITHRSRLITDVLTREGKFSQSEFDEIRVELCDFISQYM